MNKVKSLQELQEIRERAIGSIDLRQISEGEKNIKLMIGMATCGIAAGARDTFNAMRDELEQQGIKNAYIVQVGCLGHCHAEPIVQVNVPGEAPVIYGHVTSAKGKEIVKSHIVDGKAIEAFMLSK